MYSVSVFRGRFYDVRTFVRTRRTQILVEGYPKGSGTEEGKSCTMSTSNNHPGNLYEKVEFRRERYVKSQSRRMFITRPIHSLGECY